MACLMKQLVRKLAEASEKAGNSHSILAKYTSDMSKEVKEAMMLGLYLLGILTRMVILKLNQMLRKLLEKQLNLLKVGNNYNSLLKQLILTQNARVTIAEALVESGKWSTMTLEEKQLIVQNQAGLQAIFDSENHLKNLE